MTSQEKEDYFFFFNRETAFDSEERFDEFCRKNVIPPGMACMFVPSILNYELQAPPPNHNEQIKTCTVIIHFIGTETYSQYPLVYVNEKWHFLVPQ